MLNYNRVLVEEVLRPLRGRSVLYLPNGGNAGDALISVGTIACMQRLGIQHKSIGAQADVSGKVVLLGGGGNLIGLYTNMRGALANFKDRAREIVLLPHTVRGNEDLLSELGSNVTIICRDVASYCHVSSICDRPTVLLGHDMAFHIDWEEFLLAPQARAAHRPALEETLAKHGTSIAALQSKRTAIFGRLDRESKGEIPQSDLDPSKAFTFGVYGEAGERSAWCLLELIRSMPAIETDRLHIGIGSALVGTPCTLHDNSYGKNQEVYTYSIKYQFRHVVSAGMRVGGSARNSATDRQAPS